MSVSTGQIELHLGPSVLGAPDDLEAVIVGFLNGAETSLEIAVQEIDSQTVAMAIVAAKQRGVRVRVILEGDYLVERPVLADPWQLTGQSEANRVIHAGLLRRHRHRHRPEPGDLPSEVHRARPHRTDGRRAHGLDELHTHGHRERTHWWAGRSAATT